MLPLKSGSFCQLSSMMKVVKDSSISFDKIWPWALLNTPRCFDSYLNKCLDIVLTNCTKLPFGTLFTFASLRPILAIVSLLLINTTLEW